METEKTAICRDCLEPRKLHKWHDCYTWYGARERKMFKPEMVATMADVRSNLQRVSKFKQKRKGKC